MRVYVLINKELGWDNIVSISPSKVGCIENYTCGEIILKTEEEAEEYIRKKNKYLTFVTHEVY